MSIGYLFAFLTSVFFSLYLIPRKYSRANPAVYTLFLAGGFFAFSIISYFVAGFSGHGFDSFANPVLLLACLNGASWAVGFTLFTKAIDMIGLSRSNQWKNLQGPIGIALCLWLLSEATQTNYLFVIGAALTILISAMLFSIKNDEEKKFKTGGILLAVMAAMLFGTNTAINKFVVLSGAGANAQQICMSGFMFMTMLIYCAFALRRQSYKISDKNNWLGVIGGAMYWFASFFIIKANQFIPGSIAATIFQLNGVWTVLIGVLWFREINFARHWKRIIAGLAFAILGIILLVFA